MLQGHSKDNQDVSDLSSSEETPPPLPARPSALLPASPNPHRPQLQSKATTGIFRAEAQGHAVGASNGNPQITVQTSSPRSSTACSKQASRASSIHGDSASIASTIRPFVRGPELESLFDDFVPECSERGPAPLGGKSSNEWLREQEISLFPADELFEEEFQREFDDVQVSTKNEG